jgi:hypothetical protein
MHPEKRKYQIEYMTSDLDPKKNKRIYKSLKKQIRQSAKKEIKKFPHGGI